MRKAGGGGRGGREAEARVLQGSRNRLKRISIRRMKTVKVKISDPLASWLARRSHELGRPQSALIREALQQVADATSRGSCHDLFADVCGIIDGHKALSTNSKHFAGFGA